MVVLLLPLLVTAADISNADDKWWQALPRSKTLLELPPDLVKATSAWDIVRGPSLAVVTNDPMAPAAIQNAGTMNHVSVFRSRRPVQGPCVVEALVRIAEPAQNHASVTLLGEAPGSNAPPAVLFRYYADTIPASEPHTMRIETSRGLQYLRLPPPAEAPPAGQRWFRMRVVCTAEETQECRDGQLVGSRGVSAPFRGHIVVKLAGLSRLASLTVRDLPPVPSGCYPIALDALRNARAVGKGSTIELRENALPPAGETVLVDGKPFAFPPRTDAGDHVDLAASAFALANTPGAFQADTLWPAPGSSDGGRLMLNVRGGFWRRLWLIAAFDERELHIPTITARFFRPGFGPLYDVAADVPSWRARESPPGARSLGVATVSGKSASLWLFPVDLDPVAAAQSGCIELTKGVHGYRNYPDPCNYSALQGGLPSGVRVFAATLEESPLRLSVRSSRPGNVFVLPERPLWNVAVGHSRDGKVSATVKLTVTDPYGRVAATNRTLAMVGRTNLAVEFALSPAVLGLHTVCTEVASADVKMVTVGTFVQLPANTRKATAKNGRWGLWCWDGGHGTLAGRENNLYLLRAAGAIVAPEAYFTDKNTKPPEGMMPPPNHWICPGPKTWPDPYTPAEYEAFADGIGAAAAAGFQKDGWYSLFTEKAISLRVTYGTPPEYIGETWSLTPEEKSAIRNYMLTAKAACEGIRKHAPNAKINLGHCEPIFSLPLFKAGLPGNLPHGIGVDTPQFERMPEMPVRSVTPSRMWLLKDGLRQLGIRGLEINHVESYFPSSHPLALGHRVSADYVVRTAVLSLAQGSTRLLYCFALDDCSDYWGNQHYGCAGLIGAPPDSHPKPAFPAYATMTRLLDLVEYDGYVRTGSRSAYCVRFRDTTTNRLVYCLWTIRGERAATIGFAHDGTVSRVDENGNESRVALTNRCLQTRLSGTPFWIVSEPHITSVELGRPEHRERPGPHTLALDPLDSPWASDDRSYGSHRFYASNHWDLLRVPGAMLSRSVISGERTTRVWRIELQKPEKERKLAAWYGVFVPTQPIKIPGRARALGVWANGRSNWGRIIYEVEDAKGEVWQSIGAKDEWNCDDTHSWSSFNFDGWRYLRFPLPGHLPYDNYRDMDTVWWNCSAEGVVDLPVKLTRVIVEMRTHNVYADDCLEESDRSVELDDLTVEYDDAESMTVAPVARQREAARMALRRLSGGAQGSSQPSAPKPNRLRDEFPMK